MSKRQLLGGTAKVGDTGDDKGPLVESVGGHPDIVGRLSQSRRKICPDNGRQQGARFRTFITGALGIINVSIQSKEKAKRKT